MTFALHKYAALAFQVLMGFIFPPAKTILVSVYIYVAVIENE